MVYCVFASVVEEVVQKNLVLVGLDDSALVVGEALIGLKIWAQVVLDAFVSVGEEPAVLTFLVVKETLTLAVVKGLMVQEALMVEVALVEEALGEALMVHSFHTICSIQ